MPVLAQGQPASQPANAGTRQLGRQVVLQPTTVAAAPRPAHIRGRGIRGGLLSIWLEFLERLVNLLHASWENEKNRREKEIFENPRAYNLKNLELLADLEKIGTLFIGC